MGNGSPQGGKFEAEAVDPERRETLKRLGKFAVYASPAMTVLSHGKADAHHKPGHTANCKKHPDSAGCSRT